MKRIFAILMAFLVLLAPAALAEAAGDADAAASGDWYASVEGVPVALSLDPGSGYTLALPAAFGAPKSGAWALDDGFVRLDDGSVLDLVNEALLIWTANDLIFTREPTAVYAPSDLVEDALPELYTGYWRCAFVDLGDAIVPADAVDETTDLYIENATVALGGPRFGDIFWNFDLEGSGLTADVDGQRVTLALQRDGCLRLTLEGEDPATLYLVCLGEGSIDSSSEVIQAF